jgi:hypothetical protein
MRKLNSLLIIAFALVPMTANAQTTGSSDTAAPTRGWADFGVRTTSLTGAPHERYRDW